MAKYKTINNLLQNNNDKMNAVIFSGFENGIPQVVVRPILFWGIFDIEDDEDKNFLEQEIVGMIYYSGKIGPCTDSKIFMTYVSSEDELELLISSLNEEDFNEMINPGEKEEVKEEGKIINIDFGKKKT